MIMGWVESVVSAKRFRQNEQNVQNVKIVFYSASADSLRRLKNLA